MKTNYVFNGLVYIPDKKPLEFDEHFEYNSREFYGKGKLENESMDTIQGVLVDTKRFFIPGDPKAILMFAYFGEHSFNHHFSLIKSGLNLEGKYVGIRNIGGGKVKGISALYFDQIRYIDIILKEYEKNKVEIGIYKK